MQKGEKKRVQQRSMPPDPSGHVPVLLMAGAHMQLAPVTFHPPLLALALVGYAILSPV
jgi:hypothetical protein